MKKLAITLTAAMVCSVMSVCAEPNSIVPTACPISQSNCQSQQSCGCNPCEKQECKKECDPKCECNSNSAPVFNSCEEIQAWKTKYFEKRCNIYTNLGLSQEQRVKAKCLDEKFFDEIAPLKMCLKQEEAKLKDMKCKKCCKADIKCQKEKIKDLKSEIKDKKKQHEKCFEELLNSCQTTTYKKLKKEKCKEHKKPKCECGCK